MRVVSAVLGCVLVIGALQTPAQATPTTDEPATERTASDADRALEKNPRAAARAHMTKRERARDSIADVGADSVRSCQVTSDDGQTTCTTATTGRPVDMSPRAIWERAGRGGVRPAERESSPGDASVARLAASYGVLEPASVLWPTICDDRQSPDNADVNYNGNSYSFRQARNAGCVVETRFIETIEYTTGQPPKLLGTANFQMLTWSLPSVNQLRGEVGIDINKYAATGVWASGGQVRAWPGCAFGTCTQDPYSEAWTDTTVALQGRYLMSFAAPASASFFDPVINLEFRGTMTSTPYTTAASEPSWLRCDVYTYVRGGAPGCINASVARSWMSGYYYSQDSAHGQTATHIATAQNFLPDHWGQRIVTGESASGLEVQDVGTPLTRLRDQAQQDANRAAACADFVKIDEDDSCDEFPFASTYQGAAIVTDPNRRSVAHVLLSDNSAAGTVLQQFMQNSRIVDGDDYMITVDGPTLRDYLSQ